MLKKLILTIFVLVCYAPNSNAAQWVVKVKSVTQQYCNVRISRDGRVIDYKDIGTQLPTFVQSVMREIPVSQRFSVETQSNQTTIRFSKNRLFNTTGSSDSSCLSADMARAPELTPKGADTYLLPNTRHSWLDLCMKTDDGLSGECIYSKGIPLFIPPNRKTFACSNVPSTEFILATRPLGRDGYLDGSSTDNISLGTISGAGKIDKSSGPGGLQVNVRCHTVTISPVPRNEQ